MPWIQGYMHTMATIEGMKIHEEQLRLIKSSNLYNQLRVLRKCFVGRPYENSKVEDRKGILTYTHCSPNIRFFEGFTLNHLWSDCQRMKDDALVWYIHTKGASKPSQGALSWRYAMEAFVIQEWKRIIQLFETQPELDCIGAHLPTDHRTFFAGNFWWARARHIKSLPSPLVYALRSEWAVGTEIRFCYEQWITSREGTKSYAPWPWTD